MCRLSWNLGASTSWNPQGLSRPVMGLLYLTTFLCRLSWNLGASTSCNPQGLSRPVMGMLYLYLYLYFMSVCTYGIVKLGFNLPTASSPWHTLCNTENKNKYKHIFVLLVLTTIWSIITYDSCFSFRIALCIKVASYNRLQVLFSGIWICDAEICMFSCNMSHYIKFTIKTNRHTSIYEYNFIT